MITSVPATADRSPNEHPSPPSWAASVLPLVHPIAALGIVALILGRAVGPSVLGIAAGWTRTTDRVQVAGSVLSIIFFIMAIASALALALAAVRSKLPEWLRLVAVASAGTVVVISLPAAITRLPGSMACVIGAVASVLAILSAWDAQKSPIARAAAIILGVFGLSALLRIAGGALLLYGPSPRVTVIVRGLATASFVLDACATGIATAWVASRNRKLMSPTTVLAFGAALLCTRFAMTSTDEAGPALVLLRRVADRLVVRPEPYVPPVLGIFMAFLAPMIAIATLFARTLVPALGGAIALLLIARGSPEMPLGALSLLIAALAIPLGAHDDRGIWRSPLLK
jgi:hypothetical protein